MSEPSQIVLKECAAYQPDLVNLWNPDGCRHLERLADLLGKCDMLPDLFHKNPANIFFALEIAHTYQVSPISVMQSLYLVHGKICFNAQFLISIFNKTGVFSRLRYRFNEYKGFDDMACYCEATELATGEVLYGPEVTTKMAMSTGWATKNLNWRNMPELMLRYRAAAFFIRTNCPEIGMGIYTREEIDDIGEQTTGKQEQEYKPQSKPTGKQENKQNISKQIEGNGFIDIIDMSNPYDQAKQTAGSSDQTAAKKTGTTGDKGERSLLDDI